MKYDGEVRDYEGKVCDSVSLNLKIERPELHDMPVLHENINSDFCYSVSDFNRIKKGFNPAVMEDKWFIYVEEDILYMHRSWTGYLLYKLVFKRDVNFYYCDTLIVNRDPSQYKGTDDDYDIWLVDNIIKKFLLKEPYQYAMRGDWVKDGPRFGQADHPYAKHYVKHSKTNAPSDEDFATFMVTRPCNHIKRKAVITETGAIFTKSVTEPNNNG
jgi:hypothetical protein